MAANPFVATLIFQGLRTKERRSYYTTVSDVNGEYYIFPDGNTFVSLPGDQAWALVDCILPSGDSGTDTSRCEVYSNGRTTGDIITNLSNLNTSYFRQLQTCPIGFKPGAVVKLKQLT